MNYHATVMVWVKCSGHYAEIDKGIAHIVRYLNTLDGVETGFSCEGGHPVATMKDGKKYYGPYVTMRCTDPKTVRQIKLEFPEHREHEGWIAIYPTEEQMRGSSSG